MEDPLITALVIAVIGMSLLFLSLALFYGLLSLLAAVVRDKPSTQVPAEGAPTRQYTREGQEETVLRAAAIAIALAREAEQHASPTTAPALTEESAKGPLSPWWALHHQRQLTLPSARSRR